MPSSDFASWVAYWQVEPWGSHADETLNAALCQTMIACQGGKPPNMADLMPFVQTQKRMTPTKRKSAEQLMETFRQASKSGQYRIARNGE